MFEQAFKNIDDVLWKEAGCTTELDYTEQTSWVLSGAQMVNPSQRHNSSSACLAFCLSFTETKIN